MIATADTGFVAKLYLLEPESEQARTIIYGITPPRAPHGTARA